MRNTVGTPHCQKRVTGVRPVTQWKLSNTGVLDIVMLLHAANQSSVFKVCGPSENRPTEGPASLSGKWEVQSKLLFAASTHPSPAQGPSRKSAEPTPHPLNPIRSRSSNHRKEPGSASARWEPRNSEFCHKQMSFLVVHIVCNKQMACDGLTATNIASRFRCYDH